MEGIEGSAHRWTTSYIAPPKEDPVHLDAAFSAGETFHPETSSVSADCGIPTLYTVHLHSN